MVDFTIKTGIRPLADKITIPLARNADQEWFAEDITVLLSSTDVVGSLVVQFAFSVSSVVEYTLDGGANFIALNNGDPVAGGQNHFIDVSTGVTVNFRAKTTGTLINCLVSSVP